MLFSIAFGLKQILLADGDVIKHFPGIGYDGLDWYTEGAFFVNWLVADPPLPLPMLRPPIFVLVCALDNFLGHAGYVLGVVNGACIFISYFFLKKIVKALKINSQISSLYALPIAIGITLHPLNYFKTYISFSDNLATTLSIVAFYYFLQYWSSGARSQKTLLISLTIYLISGLTQTYGLMSLLIGTAIFTLTHRDQHKLYIPALLGSIATVLLYLAIKQYWATLLPHETTAYNFGLLKLNLNMLSFYINTWTIFFFTLPLILILTTKNGLKEALRPLAITVPLTALTILTLAFFYQMSEARYTSFALPWILATICIAIDIKKLKIIIASILIALPIVAVPANYWIPTIQSVRIHESYRWNWLFDYWNAKSVNFSIQACEIECGDEWLSKYAKTYNAYNAVVSQKYGHPIIAK